MSLTNTTSQGRLKTFAPWIMILIAALFYCYEFLLRVAPSTMLDDFMKIYNISAFEVGGIAAFYAYAYTPMQLIVGPLFDKYGIKRILCFAVFVCTAGAGLLAFQNQIWTSQLGLFLMGLGSAFAFVGTLKLASMTIAPQYLATISGVTVMLGMVGAICGQSITSSINHNFGWQTSWYIFTIAGIILFFIMYLSVRDPKPSAENVAHRTLSFPELYKELKRVFFDKKLFVLGLTGGFMHLPISVFGTLWGIPYMTHVLHVSTQDASLIVPFVFVGMGIGAPLAGYLYRFVSGEKLITWGAISMTALVFALIVLPLQSTVAIIGILLLLGIVCGTQALVFSVAIHANPPSLSGTVSSYINFLVMAVGAIMQLGIGFLLDVFWDGRFIDGVHAYSAMTYRYAMLSIPATLVISTLLYMNSLRGRHIEEEEDDELVMT